MPGSSVMIHWSALLEENSGGPGEIAQHLRTFSCRELRAWFEHVHGGSQPPLTPVSGHRMPFSDSDSCGIET